MEGGKDVSLTHERKIHHTMNTAELVKLVDSPDALAEGEQRYNEMLARSATDLEFRQRLLDDPISAIAEFNGVEVPETGIGFDIRFVENEADATIVLPDPISIDGELSLDELEAVAGGSIITVALTLSTAACASAVISAAAVVAVIKIVEN